MKNQLLALALGTTAVLGTATAAHSHAVQTDYFVDLFAEKLQLEMTATYSTGEPMQAATVLVYAPGDRETPWQESQTDDQGNFAFEPDQSLQGDWRIEFQKDGHEDILIVPVTDNGIDYTHISEAGNTDIHYAAMAPEAIGILSAVSLGVLVVSIKRRLRQAV